MFTHRTSGPHMAPDLNLLENLQDSQLSQSACFCWYTSNLKTMKTPFRAALLAVALPISLSPLFGQSSQATSSSNPEAVVGALDVLPELQVLRLRKNPSDQPRYSLVPLEVNRAFPGVARGAHADASLDYEQLTALLFAVTKDLREQNMHLGEQLEHMMGDKADLERKVHDLEARLLELTSKVDALATSPKGRDARHAAHNN